MGFLINWHETGRMVDSAHINVSQSVVMEELHHQNHPKIKEKKKKKKDF